jgi:hypothetical protein
MRCFLDETGRISSGSAAGGGAGVGSLSRTHSVDVLAPASSAGAARFLHLFFGGLPTVRDCGTDGFAKKLSIVINPALFADFESDGSFRQPEAGIDLIAPTVDSKQQVEGETQIVSTQQAENGLLGGIW